MNRSKSLYYPILKLSEFISALDMLNSLGKNDILWFKEYSDVLNCYETKTIAKGP